MCLQLMYTIKALRFVEMEMPKFSIKCMKISLYHHLKFSQHVKFMTINNSCYVSLPSANANVSRWKSFVDGRGNSNSLENFCSSPVTPVEFLKDELMCVLEMCSCMQLFTERPRSAKRLAAYIDFTILVTRH